MAVAIARLSSKAFREADGTVERKSVDELSLQEWESLREGFRKMYSIVDERGYQVQAGIHGLPLPIWCPHGTILFAIWHRPYIYFFEKALQDQMPGAALPYWNWDIQRPVGEEIPRAYVEPTDAKGQPNPLLKATISFPGTIFPESSRNPGSPQTLITLRALVNRAQNAPDYPRYTSFLENPHNGLHGYVGGTMGRIDYAAYDPIFWAHHCNVDRLFAAWQDKHPSAPPPEIADTVLAPFNVTVRDVWDIKRLGYYYSSGLKGRSLLAPAAVEAGASMNSAVKFGTPIAAFPLGQLEASVNLAELKLVNVKQPKESFEIRVFLNTPKADSTTPIEGNPDYAGSFFLFGHGTCQGSAGHCDPPTQKRGAFDLRPAHHLEPITPSLDVTEAVRKVASSPGRESAEVTVTLVAVDMKGNLIANPGVDFEGLALKTD